MNFKFWRKLPEGSVHGAETCDSNIRLYIYGNYLHELVLCIYNLVAVNGINSVKIAPRTELCACLRTCVCPL